MKVNEKIQHFRKTAGLSQEELGKKLLVSRQTVSLWETGQTLPTLDNLIRLREIFGVSIDELLSEEGTEVAAEESSAAEAAKPLECYTFTHSRDEFKKIYRKAVIPPLSLAILCLLALTVSVITAITARLPSFGQGAVVAVSLILTCAFFYNVLVLLKIMRRTEERSLLTEYTLEVFADSFVFGKRQGDTLYELKTVAFGEIERISKGKQFLSIISGGVIYGFSHAVLSPTSILYSLTERRDVPGSRPRRKKRSILSVFAVIALVTLVTLAVLFISGPMKYRPADDAEHYLGLQLPEKYSGVSMNVVEEYYGDSFLYYHVEYYYGEDEAADFEATIKGDTRWLSPDGARDLIAIYPEPEGLSGADRYIFYDITRSRINTLPERDSNASYILAAYYEDENLLIIAEFDCNG